jgi:hypothetical protein
MKNNIILRMSFLTVAALLFTTCTKTYMEKAQDGYSASKVIPVVISTSGPASVLQTFTYDYKVTYDRAGSTWSWTSTDATVQTLSKDTKTATLLFGTIPAGGKATIKVVETTSGGVASPEKQILVTVNPFCPLPIAGFVGTWTGNDGQGKYTYPGTITATLSGSKILLDGLNVGFMNDFWAENIIAGGTCLATINNNGTVDIPEQFFCDTDYSTGYKIKGSGTWGNCGAKPILTINYDIYYPDSKYWIASHYSSNLNNIDYLTATLTLN